MSRKTDQWKDRYSSFLDENQEFPLGRESAGQNEGFVLKHQMVFTDRETGKIRQGLITEEVYGSAVECLSSIRWYKIPSKLREITGLYNENDIEKLLDAAGYRSSMVAEELFDMIDGCLKSHLITTSDLNMIRKAYNGISEFYRPKEQRILSMEYALSIRSRVPAGYKALAV
ncbi:MAG: hypothetical protein GF388_06420 [Candidatus Aegiribacteria sp.]|nr:hypothetical protein [Candidatus Aegiribacteria sp.]MBD3294797.1 hypothetical protein [Candidatus Fermentibacteria bacterium]